MSAPVREDQIDWELGRVTRKGKGDKVLSAPLAADILEMLKECRGRHAERLFVQPNGEPVTASGLVSAWRRALKRAGITNLRFHDLRHTFGTRALRKTGNLKLTQKLLGHRDIRSTMRYAHVMDDDMRLALDALSEAESPTEHPTERAKLLEAKG